MATQQRGDRPRETVVTLAGVALAFGQLLLALASLQLLPWARPFLGGLLIGIAIGLLVGWFRFGRQPRRSGRNPRIPWLSTGLGAVSGLVIVVLPLFVALPGSAPGQGEALAGPRPTLGTPATADAATTPSGSPGPTASPSGSPAAHAPTPTPGSGYQADWSKGMDGWVGSAEWKETGGHLVSDGSTPANLPSGNEAVTAPYRPSSPNYTVEATIQVVSHGDVNCMFGLAGRVGQQNDQYDGYMVGYISWDGEAVIVGFGQNTSTAVKARFSPGPDAHTYRAVFKDNHVTLQVDGTTVAEAIDNRYTIPGQVWLTSSFCQVQVTAFKVTEG